MDTLSIKNNTSIPLASIPALDYERFLEQNVALLADENCHCVNYYGFPDKGKLRLICCIADDAEGSILVSSALVDPAQTLPSFSAQRLAFQLFEREIAENFGLRYADHPWLKPVRYPFNRAGAEQTIANYPFFGIESEELHEVGVGPIHAGVIEPGHFRFICNGEQILHLEIQLGYQHRGVERLFLEKTGLLQRTVLAEGIAGDTVAGHTTAFVNLWETLCGYRPSEDLQFARTLAQELERIAVHTGDLSALCTDVAFQLGSSVFGRLRTPLINYFQVWCGNRFAKGLIRAGGSHFPFGNALAAQLIRMLDEFQPDFEEMCRKTFSMPTVLARFEKTGVLAREQGVEIGTVGLAARMSGISRDIRASHPYGLYEGMAHEPVVKHHGDVYSRAQIRREEVIQSIGYMREMCGKIPPEEKDREPLGKPEPSSFALSLTEGWRGQICHCAITDERGELAHYKVVDPSFHNWLALALAVRNNEISDFPVSNKSFDLSYCGFDL
ncbi:MAG: NADH dehydrogenase subunit [Saprospirales bacterium]|nr:NADH dehydrogenase subunit [Saprospirales bacterium]